MDKRNRSKLPKLSETSLPALAGVMGGSLSTMILHPLELLKTRQAVLGNCADEKSRSQYSSMTGAVKAVKEEGGFRALYRGVGANVALSGCSWGVYFLSYKCIKDGLEKDDKSFSVRNELFSAIGAGTLTTLVTNPMSVVRTRMVMDRERKGKYGSVCKTFKSVVKHEGFKALYKGLVPNILNVSHGAIQFVAYEWIKKEMNKRTDQWTTAHTLTAASLSKILAVLTTYPLQNLRMRLQAEETKAIVRKTLFKGLYRGMTPYLIHVVPNVCVVFMVYEFVMQSGQMLKK